MLEHFYTDLDQVAGELQARQELQSKVETWFSRYGLPPWPQVGNLACLARQVVTGSYESLIFQQLAGRAGLQPIWLEYTADKFSTLSADKISLLQPHLCHGCGRKGGLKTEKITLAPIQKWDGVPLKEIVEQGISVVEYHHEQFERCLPGSVRVDCNEWLAHFGNARQYYEHFLMLFVAHAVLFENFHDLENVRRFTNLTVEPAFRFVEKIYGVKPLIVRLPASVEINYLPVNGSWLEHGVIHGEWLK